MLCACRAMAGTFFSASMLVGPHWGRSGGKADGGRPCRSRQGTEQIEGEEGSDLRTSWFLSCSQCLGSSSAPGQTCQTGLPQPSLTGVTTTFTIKARCLRECKRALAIRQQM